MVTHERSGHHLRVEQNPFIPRREDILRSGRTSVRIPVSNTTDDLLSCSANLLCAADARLIPVRVDGALCPPPQPSLSILFIDKSNYRMALVALPILYYYRTTTSGR